MEPHQLDENDEQCEIARTAAADKLMNDTTAFFDDIRIEDDANHVLKAITGNGIRFDDDAAPGMSPQTTENRALFASLEPSERSGFDEVDLGETVEISRGFVPDALSIDERAKYEAELSCGGQHDKHKEEGEKVRQFLSNLKNYPEWARSIPYVKLNAAVPKKIQMELALHLYANVNVRPKYMLMMTKDMDKNDLAMLVQKAFEPEDDIPQERTLFRLYCKNAVSGMRSMLKCLLDIATSSPALQIKNSKIVGEMKYNGSNVRMETSDLKAFYQVEEHGRALGVRFVTNFSITSTSDHRRTLDIRYYDERKSNGERATYLHLDHEAKNRQGVTFGDDHKEFSFEVDTQEMTPLSRMYPPVYDLVKFVVKLASQQSSHH